MLHPADPSCLKTSQTNPGNTREFSLKRIIAAVSCAAVLLLGSATVASAEPGDSIILPDPVLRSCITNFLQLDPDAPITEEDAASLAFLNCRGISDLSGLEHFTSLSFLTIHDSELADISPLAELTELRTLTLRNSSVTGIAALTNLEALSWLDLRENKISDLSPLTGLSQLTLLDLGNNLLTEVSPLEGLTGLARLGLEANDISELSPLRGMLQLGTLTLSDTLVSDISPLAELHSLGSLDLSGTPVTDLSSLTGMAGLNALFLNRMRIDSLAPLVALQQLQYLSASSSSLSDLSQLAPLDSLNTLDLTDNQITDLSPLANLKNLSNLSLEGNQISQLSPLRGLDKLSFLFLTNNRISDLSPIAEMPELFYVDALNQEVHGPEIHTDQVFPSPIVGLGDAPVTLTSDTGTIGQDGASWSYANPGTGSVTWEQACELEYECSFSGSYEQTVSVAPPASNLQVTGPESVSAGVGESATFSIQISSDGGDNSVQWQQSRDGGKSWEEAPAAARASRSTEAVSYRIAQITASMNGSQYRAVVTNSLDGAIVTSDAATLTVTSLPNGGGGNNSGPAANNPLSATGAPIEAAITLALALLLAAAGMLALRRRSRY